ncbi:MAG: oligosaccharide flippase family protein [Duncaniella sp.]|nr:oligosaccharide flippase family protein [Duncaniella sp.]
MSGIKSLFKDTAIYGLSSMIGRFLNWGLVPFYTRVFAEGEYGEVTYIYAFVAIAIILLTYGMETGFFRFANHERYNDPMEVYSTGLISLAVSSTLFMAVALGCITPVAELLHCPDHPSFAAMMIVAVALDAFTALPFSFLRYAKRPFRFATLKLVNIGVNIGLNLFFICLCPWIWLHNPGWIAWFYNPDFGIGYIFLANLIASLLNLILLSPELSGFRWRFSATLWREIISYSAPLLVLGVAGILNQTLGTLLFPYLYPDPAEAMTQVGIYNANTKIAIVLVMFIQAFRFAYEPAIFARAKEHGTEKLQSYRDAMRWFVIFAMFIFLVVMFYLDLLRFIIATDYQIGLRVVPIVMIGEVFFGVFFNLSLWYKLTDRTAWGMWLTLCGLCITIALNVALVPSLGYMGCAYAMMACYGAMMVASWVAGQHFYPVDYHLRTLAFYFFGALILWGIGSAISLHNQWLTMLLRTPLLLLYIAAVIRTEHLMPAKKA